MLQVFPGLMASLIPQLPGLLGGMGQHNPYANQPPAQQMPPQQAPMQPQPEMEPPTALERLLGVDPTRMSREARHRNRALGLIAAGSQLADDPGNFAGAVGRAIGTGRGAVQQLSAQEQRQAMLDQLGELEDDELAQGFQLALAQGDVETANAIRQMMAVRAQEMTMTDRNQFTLGPGSKRYRTMPDGTIEEIAAVPPVPRAPVSQQVQDVQLPDGTVVRMAVNPQTLEQTMLPGTPVQSSAQGQAAQFAGQAVSAHEVLSQLEAEGFNTPSYWDELLIQGQDVPVLGVFARGGMSGNAQEFSDARESFAEMFVRDISGAAIRPDEARRSARLFVPQAGDSPDTIERKRQRRELFIEQTAMRSGQPRRFASATEAMDEIFGENAGLEEDSEVLSYEEWKRRRREGDE